MKPKTTKPKPHPIIQGRRICSHCRRWKLLIYFPHTKGGSKKYYISGVCAVCKSAYGKKHYRANKVTYQERAERWVNNNRERAAHNAKEWRIQNREWVCARERKYYHDNRERKLAYHRKYTEEHRDKINEGKRKYYWKNRKKETQRVKLVREQNKIRYGSAFPVDAVKPLLEQAIREAGSARNLEQITGIGVRTITRALNNEAVVVTLTTADALCLSTSLNLDEFVDASEEWSERTGIEWPSKHYYLAGRRQFKRNSSHGDDK